MKLSDLAVRRPITTAMLLLSVLVFGGIAASRLPLAFLPEVDVPFIGIEIPYPDSNPAQVEREIAKPVEEVLSTLSGVDKLSSTSGPDGARFQLRFDWGQDLDVVRMQVSELMDQVEGELPEGIGQVLIYSFNTSDIPVVQGRISARGVELSENYDLLEARVLNRLRRVPGVARVDLDGVEPKEIFIDLELDRIKAHGVEVGPLIERLRSASSNQVLGRVWDGSRRLSARALGSFASVEELEEMVIDPRGLKLSDVATVSYEEPPIGYGRRLNGQDAVALSVYKESTANTVDVVRSVMRVIREDIAADPLLQGVDLFVWEDQAEEILGALNGLTRAGLLGALLAVVVLYFFLRRLGSTLIVSLSIPFSVIAACGMLWFLGKNLNILSMMGLMLGVGMLVDNAIVVLESIDRRARQEGDPREAARAGAGHVAMAVIASTLTSLIVFLPLIVGGRSELTTWLGEVGVAISLALVCSLFSSLTLIPLVAAKFLQPGKARRVPLLERLEARYAELLSWTLHHRVATFFALTLALVVGFLPFTLGWVETSTIAATVNKRIFIRYQPVDFVYKSRMSELVERVEAELLPRREELGIESVYSYFASDEAGTTLTLERQDLSDEEYRALISKLREELPGLPGVRLVFRDNSDDGGNTFFAVNFFGQDTASLERIAREAQRRLATVEGVADVDSELDRGRSEIQVRVDRDRAARLGLSAREISDTFTFTLGGLRLPRFQTGEREVETWLALRLEDRSNLADLAELPFRTIDGRPVRLGDIASFEVVERPQQIRRENRKVRLAVEATYEGEDWPAARQEIAALMDAFELPPGTSWSWNDRILEQDTQGAEMGINFLLALALVYLVMASLFESVSQPLSILFSIPFAVPGAAWMLAATGTPFNLMGQIGLLILMGIVVNNGIVLLDHRNQLRAAGWGRVESAVQAGRDRMRAILMTASTTIMGLAPLALGGSRVGGLFYYPLALTVMGGLMSSAVLTLLVLPWVDLGVEGVARWARGLWRGSAPKVREEGAEIAPEAGVAEV